MMSCSGCGRIRLPTWVVRIRSVLVFMILPLSDHLGRAQRGNLLVVIAELGEHGVGMLGERRRGQGALRPLAVDQHRAMDRGDLALGRMALPVEGTEVAHLRIV